MPYHVIVPLCVPPATADEMNLYNKTQVYDMVETHLKALVKAQWNDVPSARRTDLPGISFVYNYQHKGKWAPGYPAEPTGEFKGALAAVKRDTAQDARAKRAARAARARLIRQDSSSSRARTRTSGTTSSTS